MGLMHDSQAAALSLHSKSAPARSAWNCRSASWVETRPTGAESIVVWGVGGVGGAGGSPGGDGDDAGGWLAAGDEPGPAGGAAGAGPPEPPFGCFDLFAFFRHRFLAFRFPGFPANFFKHLAAAAVVRAGAAGRGRPTALDETKRARAVTKRAQTQARSSGARLPRCIDALALTSGTNAANRSELSRPLVKLRAVSRIRCPRRDSNPRRAA